MKLRDAQIGSKVFIEDLPLPFEVLDYIEGLTPEGCIQVHNLNSDGEGYS